ncbi:MAG: phosphate ABC transporter permease subunit PstC [Actinomycetota bacterium]
MSRSAADPAIAVDLTRKRGRIGERLIKAALLGCGIVALITTAGIVATLAAETIEFFRKVPIGDFLFGTKWRPTFNPPRFGVLPLISATMLITLIGMVIAFPLGLGSAIYLSEFASNRVRRIVKPALEILAGIPTVVLGYFALTFITPSLLQKLVPGTGVFNAAAAGIAVGIVTIPMVASISEDAMRAVPRSLREGAFAMGATRRTVATKVVVPAALSGIAAAFILALSRAIGETMIVSIAAGQIPNLSIDPRESMETMTAFIVQVSKGDTPAGSVAYQTIFALGATLFVITLGLNILSHRIVRRFRERYE